MKWVGALLLTLGTTGLGVFYKRTGYERIRELERMIWFFYYLESEIVYHKAELAAICRRGGERQKGAAGQLLSAVARRMENGEGAVFERIWREESEALLGKCPLRDEDIADIREFAAQEFADSRMQLVQAAFCREKLEEKRKRLSEEAVSKSRIYVCMGAMGGLVISIVLL